MAGTNGYIGQLQGPFSANAEIMDLIVADASKQVNYLIKLGVQTKVRNEVIINNVAFEIGITGILEFGDGAQITSIKFSQNVGKETIIDFIYV